MNLTLLTHPSAPPELRCGLLGVLFPGCFCHLDGALLAASWVVFCFFVFVFQITIVSRLHPPSLAYSSLVVVVLIRTLSTTQGFTHVVLMLDLEVVSKVSLSYADKAVKLDRSHPLG